MDSFESGGVGAGIVIALGLIYKIYQAINHKHIRSRCCGRELDASLDISDTGNTPVRIAPAPENAAVKQNELSTEAVPVKNG